MSFLANIVVKNVKQNWVLYTVAAQRKIKRRDRSAEGAEKRDAEGVEGVENGDGVSPSPAD